MVHSIEEIQGLVVSWALVNLGMDTFVTLRQEPEHRELEVRRGGWGAGESWPFLEEVGGEREGCSWSGDHFG